MTARDRILVAVMGVAVVLGGFWFMALGPKRAESSKIRTEVTAVRAQLAEATSRTAQAEEAQRSYGADSAAVAKLGKAVPADEQTDALLYQLDAAAGRSHVQLKSISPSVVDPSVAGVSTLPAGVTELSLSLSFEGRFADLQRFLRRVQSAATVEGDAIRVRGRLLTIKGVTLTPDPQTGRVQAVVTAAAYAAAPAAPPATSAAPAAPPATASTAAPTQPAMIGAPG
jgi:Tfp pilus assembly protein PilO